jgi:hypothetical protein
MCGQHPLLFRGSDHSTLPNVAGESGRVSRVDLAEAKESMTFHMKLSTYEISI